jgi:arabinan endo-1,5-alpha-L-arabinosidase
MPRRFTALPARLVALLALLALAAAVAPAAAAPAAPRSGPEVYRNPLPVTANGTAVESCADPSVIRAGDGDWYMYCTTDPLSATDRDAQGNLIFRLIPTFRSTDLVNWTYVGDAFTRGDPQYGLPSYADPSAALWAPEIDYFNGTYYLFYGVTNVLDSVSGAPGCGGDNAIGVATSSSPIGPWTHLDRPLIDPRYNGLDLPFGKRECNFFWTFDPEVIQAANNDGYFIYYGSYYGGIEARPLDLANLTTGGATPITIANRYEGPEVVFRDGFYYLFVSATDCCRGPLTGYSVFVGRSANPLGPFVDREGVSLLDTRVGGTPVLSMNGNRWVGLGHNTVFQDVAGNWWTIYHAVDQEDPYFDGAVGFTKRPALLDPVDWLNGWPTVRGGNWASDNPVHAPAAQEGDKSNYRPRFVPDDRTGQLLERYSDEFGGASLAGWEWVRQPAASTYGLGGGSFTFRTQSADLFVDSNNAAVLTRSLPGGNYVVETKVKLDVPPEGCCYNFTQAGLVIYGDDDNFIKLVTFSLWETRQTEFAKEEAPVPAGYPRYGNTVVGPPGEEWTYLRIVRRVRGGEELYTAYTSRDGERWVRGGTWAHDLGDDARIGLVSMGGAGFTATFDYVRVYRLKGGGAQS